MKTIVHEISTEEGALAPLDLSALRSLGPERFEDLCAGVFKHTGYFVEPTGLGPGYGIDLILATIGEGGYADDWVAMRCLSQGSAVTAADAKAFVEAMESEGFGRGILVTAGDFLPEAEEAVADHSDLRLIDGNSFLAKMASLSGDAQQEVMAVASAA